MALKGREPFILLPPWPGITRKDLPAFSIYGHDVQDSTDTSIPADVKEKLLRFAKAGCRGHHAR